MFSIPKRSRKSSPASHKPRKCLPLSLEALEGRQMLSGTAPTASFSNGLLHIQGTKAADQIVIERVGTDIQIDGVVITGKDGKPTKLPVASINSVRIDGNGGNDLIWVKDNLSLKVDVHEGGGVDQIVFGPNTRLTTEAGAGDRLVTGDMAVVWSYMDATGQGLGRALTNATPHRLGGAVQQYQFADVWVRGSTVQVYLSNDRALRTYSLARGTLSLQATTQNTDYDETDFLNYRATYDHRPTLFVLTHGLVSSGLSTGADNGVRRGYGLDDWQNQLAGNLARETNAAGSMVHIMKVDWAAQSPNTSAVKQVADHIKDFLAGGQSQWDVMLIGHSRGGIFSAELARELDRGSELIPNFIGEVPASLSAVKRIRTLQVVMLDPTAAVSMGDVYPSAMPAGVDRAVDYDDKLQLYPLGLTKKSLPIAGAEYIRVTVPETPPFNGTVAHLNLPVWYSEADRRGWGRPDGAKDLVYSRDLSWTLAQKPLRKSGSFQFDSRAGSEVFTANPPANGTLNAINVGGSIRNGDTHGYISILVIGGAAVTFGRSGLDANVGVTMYGSAAASLSQHGLAVNYAGPGYGPLNVNASVIVGSETKVDADLGPIHVSLFGPGAGIEIGGQKLTLSPASVSAGLIPKATVPMLPAKAPTLTPPKLTVPTLLGTVHTPLPKVTPLLLTVHTPLPKVTSLLLTVHTPLPKVTPLPLTVHTPPPKVTPLPVRVPIPPPKVTVSKAPVKPPSPPPPKVTVSKPPVRLPPPPPKVTVSKPPVKPPSPPPPPKVSVPKPPVKPPSPPKPHVKWH
jgi:hypothetical protein